MKLSDIKFDCKYFKGDIPCIPNKERNKICDNCDEYIISKKILIIKLGAAGDVIRTTPLVIKYKELYPDCQISWITNFPEILSTKIDKIYKFDFKSTYILLNQKFDIAINLDKDIEACAFLKDINAKEKYGFTIKSNNIYPETPAASHKLITGLYDKYSKENQKNYLEEIFEICHLKFNKEPYILDLNPNLNKKWNIIRSKAEDKIIIGIGTGCGEQWPTRLWPITKYIELLSKLWNSNFFPVLLGGPNEDSKNKNLNEITGAYYPGHFSLEEFIAIVANTDLVVTPVSMLLHIATGLKKPIILFNNIFNKNEFELYGRGEIIEPSSGCDCYYGTSCKRNNHCMHDISVDTVYNSIIKNIK